MTDKSLQPNQYQQVSVELDGTFKRGGIPLPALSIRGAFSASDREFHQPKGQRFNRTAIANVNYTLSVSDYLVGITSLVIAPSIGLPLPSLVGTGKHFIVKDEAGGALTTNVTIRSDGERLIDGATSKTIITNYGSTEVYTDGSNWFTC